MGPPLAFRYDVAAMAGLVALCLIVYGRCVTFEYTLYDDPNIIFENDRVMAGLTWDSIRWAILNPNFGLYMPLPTLTFMLDRELFGDWAGGYHGMTLLWHIVCVCLFYRVLSRLTGEREAVFAASLLVAVHPIQAMTVNWISARNEIMPAVFMLLSLAMYRRRCDALKGAAHPVGSTFVIVKYTALSVLFMFLGIMSKQGIVLLPFVLMAIDFWPLRRFDLQFHNPRVLFRRGIVLFVEKLPWMAVSAVGVALAIYGKRDFHAFQEGVLMSPWANVDFALVAYMRYLFHLVYPERLIMAYSALGMEPKGWMVLGGGLVMGGITGIAVWQRDRWPWLLVGWSWFVLFLLPVSGLVRYANESIALRYLYAPGMGLFIAAGWGVWEGARRVGKEHASSVFYGMLFILSCVLGALAYRQSGFWRTAETLAQRALAVTGGTNAMAHNHLSVIRDRQGLKQQAFAHARRAMEMEPGRLLWKLNYGMCLNRQLRYEETLALTTPLLEHYPDNVTLLNLHGGGLAGLTRFEEAIPYLERAIVLEPRHVPPLVNLGICMEHLGRLEEATAYYRRALALQPTHRMAQQALERLAGEAYTRPPEHP